MNLATTLCPNIFQSTFEGGVKEKQTKTIHTEAGRRKPATHGEPWQKIKTMADNMLRND